MAIEGPTLIEFLGKEFDEIVERVEKPQRLENAKASSPKASKKDKEDQRDSKNDDKSETPNEVLEVAKQLYDMDFSIIPIKPMSKAPAILWKEFEERRPEWGEIEPYFKPDSNLAVILGKVSNNLAVLDFETQDGWDRLKERLSEELANKLESSWIERSKRGLHIFFKLPFVGEDVKLKEAEIRARSKKYVLVYPSIHPEGVPYERIRGPESLVQLNEEEWEELFNAFKEVFGLKKDREKSKVAKGTTKAPEKSTTFDPTKWLDSFTKFWKEGVRHTLALGIAGTLAKNGVPVSEALELIRAVVERTEDRELEDRVRAVLDTYAAVGYDRESLLKECEEVVDPSLCKFSDREVEVAKLNTVVSNNEEGFKAFYGEDFSEFLKLVREFEGQFRKGELLVEGLETPFLLDFNEKVVKAMKKKDWRPLLAAVPTKLIKVEDELYVEFQSVSLGVKAFGPANLGRLAKEIAEELGVWKGSKADAYVKELIASILKSKPKEITIEERPGVWSGLYWWKGSFVLIDVPKPSEEELKKAFELLMALREYYSNEWRPVFWTLIKWGLVAPMFYALRKRYRESVQALVLSGRKRAGKSTLAEISVKLSGGEEGAADTKAAFSQLVSSGLAPVFVEEGEAFVQRIQEDPGYMALVKRLFSDKIRGIGTPSGKTKSFEPRRTLLITMNAEFEALPQVMRRVAAVRFPEGEVERREGFGALMRRVRRGELVPLSYWSLHEFVEEELWKAFERGGWKELADTLIERLLRKFGREELIEEAKVWALRGEEENEGDLRELVIDKLKEALVSEVREEKPVLCVTNSCSPSYVLERGTKHFRLIEVEGKQYLVIFRTKQLLKRLRLQLTPKQFAELLGGTFYEVVTSEEVAKKGLRSVSVIPVEQLPEDFKSYLEYYETN